MEGFFIMWLVFAIGVGLLANSRGRNGFGFFLLSVLLSPLVGLIVVLVIRDENVARENEQRQQREAEMRLAEVKALAAAASRGAADSPAQAPAPQAAAAAAPISVADELTKLSALRDKGLLTDEEFNHQRRVLLNMPAPKAQ